MPPPPIVPQVLPLLLPYLQALEQEWMAQPADRRVPTLPSVSGKVNLAEIVRVLGLNPNWDQHFHHKKDLSGPVNALARAQGLEGIGSRSAKAEPEDAVKKVIARQGGDNKRLAEQLAEAQAVIIRQQREIVSLKAQLGLVQDSGVVLRTAPVRTA
ncbi:hypothetical protein JHL17_30080 [Azospirillum sp. YIM B02556]|uniref:Transposase n=1 Tax=Azospirillum endophyticum TaxID=2800326 RepID=A0ABS1FDX7_9PROT|nr:hypothetical protein [Azospirillum endophyticum]MBK1841656.1 hypothetical protein [Azospirillum endophyticum]